MKGQEIIDFLLARDMQQKEVLVNFSINNNCSYLNSIKDITWDADEIMSILYIGSIDDVAISKEKCLKILSKILKQAEQQQLDEEIGGNKNKEAFWNGAIFALEKSILEIKNEIS
jgi:hypothetical protein